MLSLAWAGTSGRSVATSTFMGSVLRAPHSAPGEMRAGDWAPVKI